MPLRRRWARQQVAEVLRVAQTRDSTARLVSIRNLQQEFERGGSIREATAHQAAIDMMIECAIPDPQWAPTLDAYLNQMAAWYRHFLITRHVITSQSDPTESGALRGLYILCDFARHPGCAVSSAELSTEPLVTPTMQRETAASERAALDRLRSLPDLLSTLHESMHLSGLSKP